ncbi:MAG TPA: NAD(P)-dependent oxidoreductase [Burkholderiales bacterium]
MKIGIAGTGRMGAAIGARLASLGHEMMVWNRTPDKARATGLPVAASARELAERSELVITILTDAPAVEQVYGELLGGEVRGRLFVEMSTVRPAVPERISSLVKRKGGAFVECPVGGTIGPAREGKLFGFVGGEAADVARARPVLEQMCRRVEHVGPIGAGARMKLAINLPLLVYWQALGEALSLVRDLGLEPARLMDILADTSGAPNMMKNRAATVAAALAGREPSPVTVNVDTMKKDLAEMVEELRSLGRESLVARAALEGFERASRAGLGAKDCAMIPVAWSPAPGKG